MAPVHPAQQELRGSIHGSLLYAATLGDLSTALSEDHAVLTRLAARAGWPLYRTALPLLRPSSSPGIGRTLRAGVGGRSSAVSKRQSPTSPLRRTSLGGER
eukprot:13361697-Heterocapsa_arctica.AAC.1